MLTRTLTRRICFFGLLAALGASGCNGHRGALPSSSPAQPEQPTSPARPPAALAPPPDDYAAAGLFQLFPLPRYLAADSESVTRPVKASRIDESADSQRNPAPRTQWTRRMFERKTITVGQLLNALSGAGEPEQRESVAHRQKAKRANVADASRPALRILPDESSRMIQSSSEVVAGAQPHYQLADATGCELPLQPVMLGLPEFVPEPGADYFTPAPVYQPARPIAAPGHTLSWSTFIPHRPRTLAPPRELPPYEFGHSFGRRDPASESWINDPPAWPY